MDDSSKVPQMDTGSISKLMEDIEQRTRQEAETKIGAKGEPFYKNTKVIASVVVVALVAVLLVFKPSKDFKDNALENDSIQEIVFDDSKETSKKENSSSGETGKFFLKDQKNPQYESLASSKNATKTESSNARDKEPTVKPESQEDSLTQFINSYGFSDGLVSNTKTFTMVSGKTLFQLFREANLHKNLTDINQMLKVNGLLNNLKLNEKILVEFNDGGKITKLEISSGYYELVNGSYRFYPR